jgi:lysozyme
MLLQLESRRALPALGALLATLVAGCSGGDGAPGEDLGQAEEPIVVCAKGATVKGVDVSVYQGNVNWGAVKAAGIGFAIARISDGSYMDTKFDQNWSGMKGAGVVRGAYQFFEPGEDPVAQANIVINKVGKLAPGDLPVTADVEVTGGQSPATIASHLQTWVDHVQAGTGKAPMIYTAPGFWKGSVGSTAFKNLPLWGANWGVNCPNLATGWTDWVVWQYSDAGKVNGIPATVDLDEFNGSMADLQAFAGQQADWGGKFVKQSFPYAVQATVMTVNQDLPASIEMQNVGTKTWDSNTKLATTQPRDRSSIFVAPDWPAPNRLDAVKGTVAPGGSYKFQFTFHAPDKPGTYHEFFGMVQEGVHWFSDPGEAGPPDDQLEAQIQIVNAEYYGKFVKQSYPTLQQPAFVLAPGKPAEGFIELQNVGTATWKAGVTKLAPTPRDKPSPLAGKAWLSPTRVSTLAADVPPGSVGHFPLELFSDTQGDYTQTFALVEEAVTWFADAPKGGGPPDDFLAVHVVVRDAPVGTGGGGAGGETGAGGGGTGGEAGAGGGGVGGGAGAGGGVGGNAPNAANADMNGGCSCRAAGDARGAGDGLAWLGVAGALAVAGRRAGRRRAR